MRSLARVLDHLLTEFAQRDAVLGERRMVFDHANDIAPGRIGIKAEQQIGRGEMKETQRVGLHDLAAMQHFPQLCRGRRNAHAHDGVASLDGGQQMADRANSADARGDGRHFVEGPAFGEFLEAAKLRDVERRVGDLAVLVEVNGDFRVTFDAGDRVNDNGPHDGLLSQTALWSSGRGCGRPRVR